MTGRHEGPPLGSAARDATAPLYHGKRRAVDEPRYVTISRLAAAADAELYALSHHEPEPDDPPRCWSCGHHFGDGCECTCCNDTHDGGPDDV